MATHTKLGAKNAMDVNVANDISLEVKDIQIGAVEIKNHDTDDRAIVGVGSSAVVGDDALYVADANVKESIDSIKDTDGIKKITDNVNIGDVSAGTQTNDVKITLDSEVVEVDATGQGDVPITLDGEDVNVTATDLDIRDLSETTDAVSIYGSDDGGTTKRLIKTDSGGAIQVDLEVANVTVDNAAGASAVNIQDGGNSITIDGSVTANAGTDLNTSALALDSTLTDSSQKTQIVDGSGNIIGATSNALDININSGTIDNTSFEVTQSNASSLKAEVSATDLDIRDLTHVSDSVKIGDGTETVNVNASNELEVNVNSVSGLEVVQDNAGDLNVTEANSGAIKTAVEKIDDAIDGTEMQVDVVTMPDVVITSGAVTATLANDAKIDCNGSSVVVSGTATNTPVAKTSVVKTTDGQVKGSAGTVYGILVSYVGVTAGDKIELKNSTDNSGTSLITIVASGSDGTNAFYPCVGITYDTGIYYDETIGDVGAFTTTIIYE